MFTKCYTAPIATGRGGILGPGLFYRFRLRANRRGSLTRQVGARTDAPEQDAARCRGQRRLNLTRSLRRSLPGGALPPRFARYQQLHREANSPDGVHGKSEHRPGDRHFVRGLRPSITSSDGQRSYREGETAAVARAAFEGANARITAHAPPMAV